MESTSDARNLKRLHTIVRARPLITAARRLHRLVAPGTGHGTSAPLRQPVVTSALEAAGDHYRQHQWAFIETILDPALHAAMVDSWPSRRFLMPPRSVQKSYDSGFRWVRGQAHEPEFIDLFPAFKQMFEYFRGPEMAKRVTDVAGDGIERTCYSFLLTSTYPGSEVTIHRDGVAFTPDGSHFINIVMFINGSGGPRSGGLCIVNDDRYEDVAFEPMNLRNTALMYHSGAPFYHGFKPVASGKFRWSIATQFCKPSFRAGRET